MDFLQGKLLKLNKNESVSAEVALKKKNLIAYYFTRNKCDACRAFDPKLKEVYEEALIRRVELAVIVISTDVDQENFTENLKNYQDWLCIKFDDELTRLLVFNYGVTHIPSVIVVRKNGTVVTKLGKNDVDKIGINVLVTWSE